MHVCVGSPQCKTGRQASRVARSDRASFDGNETYIALAWKMGRVGASYHAIRSLRRLATIDLIAGDVDTATARSGMMSAWQRLWYDYATRRIDRRSFTIRAAALGISAPLISIMAANPRVFAQ